MHVELSKIEPINQNWVWPHTTRNNLYIKVKLRYSKYLHILKNRNNSNWYDIPEIRSNTRMDTSSHVILNCQSKKVKRTVNNTMFYHSPQHILLINVIFIIHLVILYRAYQLLLLFVLHWILALTLLRLKHSLFTRAFDNEIWLNMQFSWPTYVC